MTEISDNFSMSSEPSLLKINTMTNNAILGLKYLLNSNSEARELLKSGVEFCSTIEKGESIKDVMSNLEPEISEFMQILNRVFRPEEMSNIVQKAKKIKKRLNYALTEVIYIGDFFSFEEIYEMQKFFSYVGEPFLRNDETWKN